MSTKLIDDLPEAPKKKIRTVSKGTHPAKSKHKSERPDVYKKIWNLASRNQKEAAEKLASTMATARAKDLVTEGLAYFQKRKDRKGRNRNLANVLKNRIAKDNLRVEKINSEIERAEGAASIVDTFRCNELPVIKDTGGVRYILINVPDEKEYQDLHAKRKCIMERISRRKATLKTL